MLELFLDVDGVILDFESTFMDFVREFYIPELPQNYLPKSWELKDDLLSQLDVDQTWNAFMGSGRFAQLNLLADKESFNRLGVTYPLHLVTNLPQEHYGQRVKNLTHHGLTYTSLNLGGHHSFGIKDYPSKAQVIQGLRDKNRQVFFLDDHPENCRQVKAAFPQARVFLMQRPHNEDLPDEDWERILDWQGFVAQVDQAVLSRS